jgi:hypothetical protein
MCRHTARVRRAIGNAGGRCTVDAEISEWASGKKEAAPVAVLVGESSV